MNTPTIEQQFALAAFNKKVDKMSHEEAQQALKEMYLKILLSIPEMDKQLQKLKIQSDWLDKQAKKLQAQSEELQRQQQQLFIQQQLYEQKNRITGAE